MKEYIAKEDVTELLKALNGKELAESIVNEMPTVSEADICREFKLEVLKNIEIGIENTGHTDQYSTGFCNALIWLRTCITAEEPKFLEMEEEE